MRVAVVKTSRRVAWQVEYASPSEEGLAGPEDADEPFQAEGRRFESGIPLDSYEALRGVSAPDDQKPHSLGAQRAAMIARAGDRHDGIAFATGEERQDTRRYDAPRRSVRPARKPSTA
jgi:peptide methionine sulfoxide reductase MsrB